MKNGRPRTRLAHKHARRFEEFLDRLHQDVRAEPPTDGHTAITERMVKHLAEHHLPPVGARVLDLGCGQGAALRTLSERGFQPVGVTLSEVDAEACRRQGFTVMVADASFTDLADASFDVVWCRHVLEHSAFPYFTLRECCRLLKAGGLLYVEVPAPGTRCRHEDNPNHYSVMGRRMWEALMGRAGFTVIEEMACLLSTPMGPDRYLSFVCRKGTDSPANPPTSQKTRQICPTPDPAPLYLALPVGGVHGWGICGWHLTKQMSRLTPLRLVCDNFPDDDVDPLDAFELRHLAPTEGEHQILDRGDVLQVPSPVLHAIAGPHMEPVHSRLKGKHQVGYAFFEDTDLSETAIEHARGHFDVVATGSSWCTDVLTGRGLDNVVTVLQGVDPELFEPSPVPRQYFPDRFVIFSGGKFELRKGQDLVLRAFKILQDKYQDVLLIAAWFNPWKVSIDSMGRSPYLRFAASGNDYFSVMRQALATNGIDLSGVVLVPRTAQRSLPRIYKNSDVGLFPSRREGGTNLVMMEYMACGKAAIASYNTGQRDILTDSNCVPIRTMGRLAIPHHDNAGLTSWDDPSLDEIVAHLEWAYHHRDRLPAIGTNAAEDLKKLSWAATAARFLQLLGI